ncbi:MAG: hypothetical protein E7022_00610 [Desulfovibrio desulfuricans]|jgi:hypothetical protein|nr:hypothetical protein [Desulfovibrio desulfuricans]MBO6295551.1 hypothetical protein [Schwartzia sp. (in: firmicutes)]
MKKLTGTFFVFLLVLATGALADAGPLSIKVTNSEAGGMSGGKQAIIFWMTVKNTSSVEYIGKLNSVTVEVIGRHKGGEERYERKVNVDWTFDPALGPGKNKKLKTRFMRQVNPGKGWYRYNNVKVRVLKYNFRRES